MTKPAALERWLVDQGASHDLVSWVRQGQLDWSSAWERCPRGDWLLAIAVRLDVERVSVVRAACACARGCLDLIADPDAPATLAIVAAERWADGVETPVAVRAAAERVEEFPSTDVAVDVAHQAAALAARSVEELECAPAAAVTAAHASMLGVADCAMLAVLGHAHAQAADAVRALIPFEKIVLLLGGTERAGLP